MATDNYIDYLVNTTTYTASIDQGSDSSGSGEDWYIDKTYDQIKSMYDQGYSISAKWIDDNGNQHVIPLTKIYDDNGVMTMLFSESTDDDGQQVYNQFTLTENNELTFTSGSSTVTYDDALSDESTNAVQNKVITGTIGDVESLLAAL